MVNVASVPALVKVNLSLPVISFSKTGTLLKDGIMVNFEIGNLIGKDPDYQFQFSPHQLIPFLLKQLCWKRVSHQIFLVLLVIPDIAPHFDKI